MSLRPKPTAVCGKARRLDVVLRAGASFSAASDQTALQRHILGVLNMDPEIVMSVRGLLRLLQLCQVSSRLSAFLNCNDKDTWKELLRIASQRLANMSIFEQSEATGVLKSLAQVDAVISSTSGTDDRQVANIYKREFTRHVLYHALYTMEKGPDDVSFVLIQFSSQIETFLGRKNGSMPRIVEEIKRDMIVVRRRTPDFPPVPSDFYVGAVEIVAEVTNKQTKQNIRRFYQSGRFRIPDLVAFIRETDYY